MAGAQVYIGTGTTLALGTSSYAADLISMSWAGINRPVLEATPLGVDLTPGTTTFGNEVLLAGSIAAPGELTVEVYFDPTLVPPMVPGTVEKSETITITFPKEDADTTAPIWACSGFCKSFSASSAKEEPMTATLVFRLTGGATITAATIV